MNAPAPVVDLRTGLPHAPTREGAREAWARDMAMSEDEWLRIGVVRAWWRKHRDMIRRGVTLGTLLLTLGACASSGRIGSERDRWLDDCWDEFGPDRTVEELRNLCGGMTK
jgi:hypothetical protein